MLNTHNEYDDETGLLIHRQSRIDGSWEAWEYNSNKQCTKNYNSKGWFETRTFDKDSQLLLSYCSPLFWFVYRRNELGEIINLELGMM